MKIESKDINYWVYPGLSFSLKKSIFRIAYAFLHTARKVRGDNNLCFSDIKRKTRKQEIVILRQIYQSLLKKYTDMSFMEIGNITGWNGGYDHATVMHNCKVIENLLETNKKFRLTYGEFFNL
jgi:chromosomal replication initiation ATPase DnaA